MNDLEPFVTLVNALAPWRTKIVFVGGWAHRLFRLDPRASKNPGFDAVYTRDADVAFDDREHFEGDIRSALREAGFNEEFFGEDRPPVTQYALGNKQGGFYAEFLTALRGSGLKRGGEADATLKKAGIHAQKLRGLDVLMVNPWEVAIPAEIGGAKEDVVGLQVANPVSFIAQKILIHDARKKQRKASNDILYIHDTIQLFGDEIELLRSLWRDDVAKALRVEDRKGVIDGVDRMFERVTDDVRDAAQIQRERGMMPDELREVCKVTLDEIFRP
jgi:hypothetical protein